jgi:hypothetical protein
MAFRIEISELAESELKAIRVFDRRTIVDQLMKEATLEQFVQDPHAFVRASQQERFSGHAERSAAGHWSWAWSTRMRKTGSLKRRQISGA